jgi:putative phosphoesterase
MKDRSMVDGPARQEEVDLGRATIGAQRLRVGLISDTHIPEARKELWPQVFSTLAGVDLILHGGDIHDVTVLDQLAELAPIYSARGNGEDGSGGRAVAPPHPQLRYSWLLELPALRLGLTHDLPVPEYPPRLTVARWRQRRFATDDIDVIVFGDSHVELIETVDGTLCVNPGSPTYPHNLNTQLGTLGFLDIDGREVHASIWQLTEDGADPIPHLDHTVEIPLRTEPTT